MTKIFGCYDSSVVVDEVQELWLNHLSRLKNSHKSLPLNPNEDHGKLLGENNTTGERDSLLQYCSYKRTISLSQERMSHR
jgi:hypothetical protein